MVRRRKTAAIRIAGKNRRTRKVIRGGAADDITGENTLGAKVINLAEKTATTVAGLADDLLGPALDSASDAVFGNKTEIPFSEAAPKLTNELVENATFLKNAASDPKVRAALQEYGEALGDAVKTASGTLRPVIDEAIEDTFEANSKAGEKMAVGTVNTGLNIFKAAVAEIPVAGGLLDLGLAGAQALDYAAQAASPLIVSGSKTMANAMEAVSRAATKIGEVKEKITTASSQLSSALTGAEAAEPLAAQEAEPLAAQEAEPLAAQEAEPLAAQEAEPLAAQEAEPLAAQQNKQTKPLAAQQTKPLAQRLRDEPNALNRAQGTAAGGGRRKAKRTLRRIISSLKKFTRRR
jgi:hypothetical protein